MPGFPCLSCRRLIVVAVLCLLHVGHAAADPLPSWKEGAGKAAILDFVAAVTTEGGPEFVPMAERVAVFDNDGTLWVEQPYYPRSSSPLIASIVWRRSIRSGNRRNLSRPFLKTILALCWRPGRKGCST